jgi:hypothetical protein
MRRSGGSTVKPGVITRQGARYLPYIGKWNLENLYPSMEIDSCFVSGKCAAIPHEPLRTPQQTFRV